MNTDSTQPEKKSVWAWCKKRPFAALLIFFLIIGFIGTFIKDENPPKPEAKKAVVYNEEFDGSVRQVRDYLRSNVKDWDSYESIEWSQVVDNGPKSSNKARYIVRHKFRAKNSFGGYEIENKIFSMDSTGNVTGVTDFTQ